MVNNFFDSDRRTIDFLKLKDGIRSVFDLCGWILRDERAIKIVESRR